MQVHEKFVQFRRREMIFEAQLHSCRPSNNDCLKDDQIDCLTRVILELNSALVKFMPRQTFTDEERNHCLEF